MKPTVIITGATKGIGLSLVNKFAANGFHIGFCSRNEKDIQQLSSKLKSLYPTQEFHGLVCDISDKKSVIQFGTSITEKFPKIDILINNAGIFIPGSVTEEADGIFEQQINTNLASAYHLTRTLVSHLYTSSKGHIFNICSTASIVPYINGGSYCISKYAMLGFSKVLREEMKAKKVRVTAVLPGATLTNSWSGTELPQDRFIQADDIADQIFHIYRLPQSTVVEELIIRPMEGDIS